MSAMEGQSTWLNIRTVRLLQGCTGDMQLCCSRDKFAPETIQLLLCRGAQIKVGLDSMPELFLTQKYDEYDI